MAYRAEIEIGVKGTEKLRELRNTVDLLAGKIDRLDSFADVFNSPIQSLKNYNQTLRTTAKALEQVELGQKDEATAIRQYVQALGQANTARARQNGLIQQEIALQEAAKRKIQPGPTGFSRAQFGPALPPAFIKQQDDQQNFKKLFADLNETAKVISVSNTNTRTSWKRTFDELNETAKAISVSRLNTQASWKTTFDQLNETAKAIAVNRLNTQTSWQETFKQLNETAKAISVSRLNTQTSWQETFKQLNETAKAISVSRLNTQTSWQETFKQLNETAKAISVSRLNTQTSWQETFKQLNETAKAISVSRLNTKKAWQDFFKEAAAVAEDLRQSAARVSLREQERPITVQENISRGRSARIARERSAFLQGSSGSVQLGPSGRAPGTSGFAVAVPLSRAEQKAVDLQNRKLQILGRIRKTRQDLVGLAANLQRLDNNAVIAIKDANRQQEELNRNKQKSLEISKAIAKSSPVGGAENIPGSPAFLRARSKRRREAASNALIGGAFPLLFGQGIGAAAGGAIGGGAGGLLGGQFGFGLSLVGTAAGNAFDELIQKAGALSVAFETTSGTSAALEAIIGRLDNSLKRRIDNLEKSGQAGAAADLAFQKLAKTIGVDNANALLTAGQDFEKIGKIIGEVATSSFALVLRLAQEIFNLEDRDPFKNVPEITPGLRRARAEAAGDTKISQLEEAASKARLENDLKALDAIERKLVLEKQDKELAKIGAAVLDGSLDKEIARDQILQARSRATEQLLMLDKRIADQKERQAKLDQKAIEQAERKRKIEADRARREAKRAQLVLRRQQVQGFNLDLQGLQVNQATVAAETGPIAALNRQILDLKEKQTILENIAKLNNKDTGLLNKQLKLIAERISLEQTVTEQKLKQLELNTEAVLVDELNRDRRSLKDAQLETEAARVALTTPFDPAAQQSNELILSQLQESTQKTRELQDRREALANAVENASNEEKAGRKLVLEQFDKTAAKIQQELALRQELERALLKQNQLIEKYGFLANELSTAMTSAVQAVVTGTGTVEEAFSTMFANIGKAFIDMATQMLAQKLFMTVLGALGGGGGFSFAGGSASSGLSAANLMGGTGPLNAGLFGRASGGSVSPGSTYMVGERGPELLTMTPSGGYVTNNSASQAAMDRYSSGNTRGGSISVNYNVTEINGMKFVTEDQFRAGISQAAKQGADGGFNRTMSSLKNSRSTRSRVGV